MRYLRMTLPLFIGIFFINGTCHSPFFEPEYTEPRKYPFSGIGLVRENPKDTIEIFYSNATEQEGINEVLSTKFATDTIVGFNESWILIEFGKQFGRNAFRYLPNYNEGEYFEICNHGIGDVFYFIIVNPNLSEDKYNFGYGYIPDMGLYSSIMTKDETDNETDIYEMLFPNGVYSKEKLKEIADLFKLHDKTGNTLFQIQSFGGGSYNHVGLNRSSNPDPFTANTYKENGKGFYYGTIYAGECMKSSENTGGIMLHATYIGQN